MPLEALASSLGLPRKWLRDEADAGRIPCLRIGRRLLFSLEAVQEVLAERAAKLLESDNYATNERNYNT